MKKLMGIIGIIAFSFLILILGFSYQRSKEPNSFFQVYLDGSYIGTIKSKNSLENYINNQADNIRNTVSEYEDKISAINDTNELLGTIKSENVSDYEAYKAMSTKDKAEYIYANRKDLGISDVKKTSLNYYIDKKLYNLSDEDIKKMEKYYEDNKIYLSSNDISTPNGIEIKKVLTYQDEVISTEDIYDMIIEEKNCTIPGYKFTITDSENNVKDVYVTDANIFKESVDTLAKIFVGESEYKNYKDDSQKQIDTTGEIIENVYVEENITYKAENIPTDEVIYTNASELSKYLLYGDKNEESVVTVNSGDSIETLAYNNQISVDEFLISNPEYTSADNLLYAGKQVKIAKVDPQVNIVEEIHSVSDIEANYNTVEVYDANMNQGDEVVTQEGENGVERVSQKVKSINGQIAYVQPVSKETIKATVDKKITVGTKVIPNVGSTSSWGWPTNSGYTISSYFGYRLAVFGEGNFHSGLDIAGTGYGSPVYAVNNGNIVEKGYAYDMGNYIIVNHNNGYYSVYAHMSGFASGLKVGSVVSRGQTIGYVGSSGWATGPHLHLEIRTCQKWGCHINPLQFYR